MDLKNLINMKKYIIVIILILLFSFFLFSGKIVDNNRIYNIHSIDTIKFFIEKDHHNFEITVSKFIETNSKMVSSMSRLNEKVSEMKTNTEQIDSLNNAVNNKYKKSKNQHDILTNSELEFKKKDK